MKVIGISFTLKGQSFEEIKNVLAMLSERVGGKSGEVWLAHGFMQRSAVIERNFNTEVVDALDELFPYQLSFCEGAMPKRKELAHFLKSSKADVYIIGDVKEGVQDEVDLYYANQITCSMLPLGWSGNMLSRPLTYGEKAVGLTFNHGQGEIFEQINEAKKSCAVAVDQMNDLRAKSDSGEYKALSTIAIRALQGAQMDMVKAITWKD